MLNGNMLCTDGARALMAAVKANFKLTYLGLQVIGTDKRDDVKSLMCRPTQRSPCSRAVACRGVAPCAGFV